MFLSHCWFSFLRITDKKILRALQVRIDLRARLSDTTSPPLLVKRPPGMRLRDYRRAIARLARAETLLIEAGFELSTTVSHTHPLPYPTPKR